MTQANEISALDSVVLQLRVPDFKYALGSDQSQTLSHEQADALRESWRQGEHPSLTKLLRASQPLAPNVLNAAFVVDRIFDVWMRKNSLHEALNSHLDFVRFDVFDLLHRASSKTKLLSTLAEMLNDLGALGLGWMPHPERSRKLYIDGINTAFEQLRGDTLAAINAWFEFANAQRDKLEKVRMRLGESEAAIALQRFARCKAIVFTNRLINGRTLSHRVGLFVARYYTNLLSLAYIKGEQENIEQVESLLKKIIAVYSLKGNAAFQFAEALIDELSEACTHHEVRVEANDWEGLEADMLRVLQKQEVEEGLQEPILFTDALMEDLQQKKAPALPEPGQWYITEDGIRQHLSVVFEESRQVLFSNYLGMKIVVLTLSELNAGLKSRAIKRLAPESTFSEVCRSAISGLCKIAETQKKARVAAAQKAKQEAEHLLAEQRRAELEAKTRAEEIARRTKEIKLKQAEKKRLEQEQELRESLGKLQLGAWIGVLNSETEKKERYKLAVKFSAKRKYLFVDKLGIRKLEFNEDKLIGEIIAKNVEVLSDGAEFEDSLERVVSRLRMAK